MKILGINIIFLLGILNMLLIVIQLLSGLHIITFKVRLHRICGILLAIFAALHGFFAIMASM